MTKTLQRVLMRAKNQAMRTGKDLHVWFDEIDGGGYQIGDDYDAETWWAGQSPLFSITLDGEIHSN